MIADIRWPIHQDLLILLDIVLGPHFWSVLQFLVAQYFNLMVYRITATFLGCLVKNFKAFDLER